MPLSAPVGNADSASLMAPALTRRMAAWLYEGVLLIGVAVMAGLIFVTITGGRGVQPAYRHPLQAFLFVVMGLYFAWCWHKGQTLAMKTWHIRITDAQGRPVGPTRALCRYLLCWLWFLPPLAVAAPLECSLVEVAVLYLLWILAWALASRWQRQRQFWHDAWAGTRLVQARPTDHAAPPTF